MTCSEAGSIVAVEVLVEQDVIPPMRIFLELLRSTVNRTSSVFILQEDAGQPARKLLGYFEERQVLPGTGGALDFELVAVKLIQLMRPRMRRPFTGIQTGPRQLELPPNIPVLDSPGR